MANTQEWKSQKLNAFVVLEEFEEAFGRIPKQMRSQTGEDFVRLMKKSVEMKAIQPGLFVHPVTPVPGVTTVAD